MMATAPVSSQKEKVQRMRTVGLFTLNLLIVCCSISIFGVIGLYLAGVDGIGVSYGGAAYSMDEIYDINIFFWLLAFLVVGESVFIYLRRLIKRKSSHLESKQL
jgi:hypothetical protein